MALLLKDFIDYLEEQVRNHGIYVWGAQGQAHPTITEAWIKGRETSTANANRAIAFWKKQCAAGYQKTLRAFDCSGLGMYWIQNLQKISKTDNNANGMMSGMCNKITRAQLQRGDWVFRVDGSKAYHIGYIVDDALNVIEAKGRDDGVVKRPLNASGTSYWNAYGRPKIFEKEIEEAGGGMAEVEVIGGSVNVREQPNNDAKIVGVAKKGQKIERLDNGWYKVKFNGKPAYISARLDLTRQVN